MRASTELGRAKEYEWKVRLEKKFGIKLDNHNKEFEFDLVGRKQEVWYIFEIKNRNKLANYEDVNHFLEKIGMSEFKDKKKRLFFISKSGFTEKARKLIEENKIETQVEI